MKRILTLVGAVALLLGSCTPRPVKDYSWEKDLHERLKVDFCRTEEQVVKYIKRYIPDPTAEQIKAWEESKALECMVLDGEKRYFVNAGPNLFRIDKECAAIKAAAVGADSGDGNAANVKHLSAVMAAAEQSGKTIVEPKRMKVTYTLTVDADAVPAGEVVRCWLPFPRSDHPRQGYVKLLETNLPEYKLSGDKSHHSTLYMEQEAVAGEPTIFSETFEYSSSAEWHNLKAEDIKPYNKGSKLYKEYTSEREKHIIFTPEMRALAAELVGEETNPLLQARKIFTYIDDNYPWASAREYSTIENIPEYVVEQGHGDCGQVSLLFITLCRICGIPAHFQSGFMMGPNRWNLHDWAEIYFEGIGWVPVDQSFGRPSYARAAGEEYFYVGGIDSWRMIVNSDYGMPLSPKKIYPRSETVDFQRGEVEWRGGNLYFPQWEYSMKIERFDE